MKITDAIEELEAIRQMYGDDIELVSTESYHRKSLRGFQIMSTKESVGASYCVPHEYEMDQVVVFKHA